MAETRGAATIVDRVEGWGHTDASDSNREDNDTWGAFTEDTGVANTITATDASNESTATRVARSLVTRQVAQADDHPDLADRTRGFGTIDLSGGDADDGYGNEWEEEDADLGTDALLEAATGSDVAQTTSDTNALATGRTADSRNTVDLDYANATKRTEAARTSIYDRVEGWGHTDGSNVFVNDTTDADLEADEYSEQYPPPE